MFTFVAPAVAANVIAPPLLVIGLEVIVGLRTIESAALPAIPETVSATVVATPVVAEDVAVADPAAVMLSEEIAALADTAVIPPIAKAAAATSATRLKAVFVDIIFLSEKVDWEHFSLSAWLTSTDS